MKQGSGLRKPCLRGAWGPLQCHGRDGWARGPGLRPQARQGVSAAPLWHGDIAEVGVSAWPASRRCDQHPRVWAGGAEALRPRVLQTPRCRPGPGASWASRRSSWTDTSAASCWPSWRPSRGASDDQPRRPPHTKEPAAPARASAFPKARLSLQVPVSHLLLLPRCSVIKRGSPLPSQECFW